MANDKFKTSVDELESVKELPEGEEIKELPEYDESDDELALPPAED